MGNKASARSPVYICHSWPTTMYCKSSLAMEPPILGSSLLLRKRFLFLINALVPHLVTLPFMHTHTRMHTYAHNCTHTYTYIQHMDTYIHTHTCAHTHTCTHNTWTHIHTHTHQIALGRPWPVALGAGFGFGYAMSNCQHDFRRVQSVYLRPVQVHL